MKKSMERIPKTGCGCNRTDSIAKGGRGFERRNRFANMETNHPSRYRLRMCCASQIGDPVNPKVIAPSAQDCRACEATLGYESNESNNRNAVVANVARRTRTNGASALRLEMFLDR